MELRIDPPPGVYCCLSCFIETCVSVTADGYGNHIIISLFAFATVTPAGQYSIDHALTLGDGVLHNDSQLVHLARDREKEDNGGILI